MSVRVWWWTGGCSGGTSPGVHCSRGPHIGDFWVEKVRRLTSTARTAITSFHQGGRDVDVSGVRISNFDPASDHNSFHYHSQCHYKFSVESTHQKGPRLITEKTQIN